MYLRKIFLKHFRNCSEQEICFSPGINVFEGKNAQGKTNLLEAIYCLSVSRSFRTNQEAELVRWEEHFFFLKGVFEQERESSTVELGFRLPNQFQLKVRGASIKRADYIHRFPVVIFSPDDLLLIKEGPTVRRRFMNLEGSRLKPLYYAQLKDFQRVLRQRNRILKNSDHHDVPPDLLEPWNRALVDLGSRIIRQRISLLRALESASRLFFKALTASSEEMSLEYISSVDFQGDLERLENHFLTRLEECRRDEIKKGYTLLGPHLDDFRFKINGREVKRFASQGQQRTASLALKMGEVELFQASGREKAVVLLDDVFSELDRSRRRQLLDFLLDREGQAFITTALPLGELVDVPRNSLQIFYVDKGKINIAGTGNGH